MPVRTLKQRNVGVDVKECDGQSVDKDTKKSRKTGRVTDAAGIRRMRLRVLELTGKTESAISGYQRSSGDGGGHRL
jgi:hypothetical protein